MKRLSLGIVLAALVLGFMALPLNRYWGQTSHGILVTWNAPTIPAGGAPIAGYNLWWAQCPGGTCGSFSQYNAAVIAGTSINIPTSAVSTNTEYGFYAVTQDVNGNLSAPSAPMTGQALASAVATTPSTWPVSPNAPSGCTAKIQ